MSEYVQGCGFPIPWYCEADEDDDLTCEACGGSGADPLEGFMPCEECDGEGYRYWE